MPSRKKIDLKRVSLASLNTTCPKCQAVIEPAQIRRINFDEIKCPWCDAISSHEKWLRTVLALTIFLWVYNRIYR